MKILSIGNSFSSDSQAYLNYIAQCCGEKDFINANLYIGGCPLSLHYLNAKQDKPDYIYYRFTKRGATKTSGYSIKRALEDEEWDIVTLQQCSRESAFSDTYDDIYLDFLTAYIKSNCTNQVKISWLMTWAYQNSFESIAELGFKNQLEMYNSICRSVKTKIMNRADIDFVIPIGTAIQNARTSNYGDNLTRDGFHLGYYEGRFIAGLTMFLSIKKNVAQTIYSSLNFPHIDENLYQISYESALNALKKPFDTTNSSFVR